MNPLPFDTLMRSLAVLFISILLTSCAVSPPATPTAQNLHQLTRWQLEGKLGFRSPHKNGSAWIHWQQDHASYQLRLTGPFGAGATQIIGDERYAVLSQSGEQDLTAANGEELTAYLFGWPLPVTQMTSWVKGVPAQQPKPVSATWDQHTLSRMNQLGWQLEYSDYRAADGWVLPGRIKGSKGETSFVLVIKSWTPLPQ
jgi:outer membrane lipoprotein LolB